MTSLSYSQTLLFQESSDLKTSDILVANGPIVSHTVKIQTNCQLKNISVPNWHSIDTDCCSRDRSIDWSAHTLPSWSISNYMVSVNSSIYFLFFHHFFCAMWYPLKGGQLKNMLRHWRLGGHNILCTPFFYQWRMCRPGWLSYKLTFQTSFTFFLSLAMLILSFTTLVLSHFPFLLYFSILLPCPHFYNFDSCFRRRGYWFFFFNRL